jgi:hypothetical protein
MTKFSLKTLVKPISLAICTGSALFATLPAMSQRTGSETAPQPRITAAIENSTRALLTGSRSPRGNPADDVGAVAPTMKLQGMSLVFSRTPAQQAALDKLLAAQQDSSSPLYHQWLTPEQFGVRFGVAEADIAAVESWLQSQGFSIDSVSRSRNSIVFSGNAGLVASAFGAPIHYFRDGATANEPALNHFAPATDLSVPAALSSSVLAITNLSSFRPHSQLKPRPQPQFTSNKTGSHFLTPGDVATIYDIKPAYASGLTGANQSIVVIGQSSVSLTDISNFQTAVGIPGKLPIPVLVPNTGSSVVTAGDESESDLDLEYSSTIARGAQIYFVYTGSSTNYNAFDSLQYAVDERLAPIISSSYGTCETSLGQTNFNALDAILQQAAAQGQTVVSSSGDNGSADCHGDKSLTVAQQNAVSVDYPASSQYVTGMGGTEFSAADVAAAATPGTATTYWAATNGTSDVLSSVLSYIPETVWNDDAAFLAAGSTTPISAGGGGASIFVKRPAWQAGTIGGVAFPTAGNGMRLVPDISLTASPGNAPFAYCTSDKTAWSTSTTPGVVSQAASCDNGLRDSATGDLTLAGGTSFDAPIFAGLIAIINQSQNSTGQGVVNPILYKLATSSAYSTAFHDITSGGNQCLAGVTYCGTGNQTSVYAAATGYDAASGLGSIDFDRLLTAWPNFVAQSAIPTTTTTLSAATTAPAVSAPDTVTVTVAALNTSAVAPTGAVSLVVDGGAATSLTLTAGVASYSFTSPTPGAHVLVATYSGDANFGASSGTLTLAIPGAVTTTGPSFTIAASVPAAVAGGSSTTSTISVAPTGGYTGTVRFTVAVPAGLTNFCYATSNAVITSASNRAGTLTLYTSAATCNSLGLTVMSRPGTSRGVALSRKPPTPVSPWKRLPLPGALAGMLMLAGFRRRSRLLRASMALGLVMLLSLSGLGLTGCSNTATSATASNTPAGAYTITVTGTDTVTSTETATTTFTLTVS